VKLTRRPYQGEDDYWRIRAFLRETYLLNGRRELNWQAYRFDYWRWHVNANIHRLPLEEAILLWETADRQIAAVLNADNPDDVCLQVHPAWWTPALEGEMLDVAEARLAAGVWDVRRLVVWADSGDGIRRTLLMARGYRRNDWPEHQRRRLITTPVPDVALPAGYIVRPLGDADELPARSWLSWRAFHPNEPDEKYEGWEWYRNVQRAPLYRRDLDLVAVAPDGELAAFCTLWFDDVTRTGSFEPVGTHPGHQRRGLGKAVMTEGLRRLQRLGATLATVGSYGEAAHGLYASMGFTEYDLSEAWVRVGDP
jgi:ribosomal protein S18 acetylase RimI-like enzyme